MAVYIIGNIQIRDRESYRSYEEGFLPIFAKYKGEILAAADNVEVLEGDWGGGRAVLLRFPSREEARRWFESTEYQELAGFRRRSSDGTIIIAEELALPQPPSSRR